MLNILNSFHVGLRGGPFDTWGAMVFLCDQTFFFDSQLKHTIFFRPYQKQTFFLSGRTQNNFFHHIFHLILCTLLEVLEVSPHLPGPSTVILVRKANCVEYVDQNCWSCPNNLNF